MHRLARQSLACHSAAALCCVSEWPRQHSDTTKRSSCRLASLRHIVVGTRQIITVTCAASAKHQREEHWLGPPILSQTTQNGSSYTSTMEVHHARRFESQGAGGNAAHLEVHNAGLFIQGAQLGVCDHRRHLHSQVNKHAYAAGSGSAANTQTKCPEPGRRPPVFLHRALIVLSRLVLLRSLLCHK